MDLDQYKVMAQQQEEMLDQLKLIADRTALIALYLSPENQDAQGEQALTFHERLHELETRLNTLEEHGHVHPMPVGIYQLEERISVLEKQHAGLTSIVANLGYENRIAALEQGMEANSLITVDEVRSLDARLKALEQHMLRVKELDTMLTQLVLHSQNQDAMIRILAEKAGYAVPLEDSDIGQ